MKEEFLHYIWKYALFTQDSLVTACGLAVEVIKPGLYNTDAGPDFQDARIKIGDSIWVGHVEIHLKSSDWFSHGHQHDKAYNQVVLHVVKTNDREVHTQGGALIPTICLGFNESYYLNFQKMVNHISPIPCSDSWKKLSVIQVESAICSMGVERMETRFQWLHEKLEINKGGWKDLYLQVFFRAFGFGKNQGNFDMLAQTIPYVAVEKHCNNLFQLESLIFGQAGLIPDRDVDAYQKALKSEFEFLKNKYDLQKNFGIVWRSRRTRPNNQPVFRLAQLAAWIHGNPDFFGQILNVGLTRSKLPSQSLVSSYWKTHLDFGRLGTLSQTSLSEGVLNLLHINAVLPLNAYYFSCHNRNHAQQDWMEVLEDLPAENNYVIKLWKDAGFRVPNAFYSQAFLMIYKNYCSQRQCLRCKIGQLILKV